MATHPIPDAALDDRLGFIGTAGSGKTYNAGGAVERLLESRARIAIVDPLGVWWGLRLLADGKTKSPYNIPIFGGAHGDLPLNEHAGALIGETAGTMSESCIVDLSQLGTKSAERRFMVAFLEAIYRKANGEPLHLVVDEADLFAPQKPPHGDEVLLNLMEQIVRRGRVKGFIPWLISQRPAVVNKNVLSQVDGLVAFKLTATHDRDALDGWIEGQADKQHGKAIKDALPTMKTGQGVVWIPGRGILATVEFPPKLTFDSSRTPKRGEKKRTATLVPVDLGTLKERLAAVEAETKANDPKALKAEVAKLKRELATKPQGADPDALREAEERGFANGRRHAEQSTAKFASEMVKLTTALIELAGHAKQVVRDKQSAERHTPIIPLPISDKTFRAALAKATPPEPRKANGQFTGPQHRVLRSLAMWRALGHDAPSREMVAAAAGYSPSSGGFGNLLGSLATAGAIEKPMPGHVGLRVQAETMTPDEGRDMLLRALSSPQRKLVDAMVVNGGTSMTREQLADATGYSGSSGGFGNLVGSLSTLGILAKPAPGHVALSDWACELLLED